MGCMSSKADINDRHPNIFQVVNIDDLGQELRPAKLEITDRDIILHQRGRSGVRWPIRCLKRYGYSEGVFSFELGRRAPTGAGVYAFKCERAEALFQLLQTCIQNPADEGRQTPAHGDVTAAANGDVAALEAWHGPADGSDQAVYVNEEVWSEEAAAPPPDAEPAKQPPVPAQRKSKPAHSYLNTVPCDINTNYQSAEEAERRHLYVNVLPEAGVASAEDAERCYVNIAAGSGAARLVNYAVLDLQAGYATIDFDKTAALSMAVSRVDPEEEAECRRKTRHNSTIVEPGLSRHNSVIST
ncbi:fibroblast growth factor receptor substrate 2-like [Pollicipes pollicipes]|uniref:fibroblast growth factor receptor substrate 2-like n=1 Tax=Pollicipes pollicipes TaxID=41117 RepID=UPI00188500BD|nr:fibroblast growth factor receptor substrate 2-like [Pollicipes pollicipes]